MLETSAMTTLGLRGLLAASFMVSMGLAGGVAQWSGTAHAAGFAPMDAAAADAGLMARIKAKACELSAAASDRDNRGAESRADHCRKRHGLPD